MMKYFKRYLAAQFIIVATLISALFVVVMNDTNRKTDTVTINDIIETAKENWNHIETLNNKITDIDILIFNQNNEPVYSSSDTEFVEINNPIDAVRNNYLTLPINEDDLFLGTVVYKDPNRNRLNHALVTVALTMIAAITIIFLSYIAFFYYVNKNIIRPFRRMKEYAVLIAQGRLDEPLMIEQNNLFGIFTESFDMMREELRASKERECALKRKEKELVASLSHDLKTPVTGIKLICELLVVKAEDEYVKNKLLSINHKTDEINILLNNLLSTSLDDMNEMSIHLREETSDIIGTLLDEHDLHKKICAINVPHCIINIDRNRLSQVIGNIISNSYKYADTKIDVVFSYYDNYLKMSIKDYGEGVEKEELDLLANKFYRGKNIADKEGSGLGLYISKDLMEKMGGRLMCSSGDGFTVKLMIPLA